MAGHHSLLFVCMGLVALSTAQVLDLTVNSDGSFSITRDGKSYLAGGEYMVNDMSLSGGSLKLGSAPSKGSGSDKIGDFDSVIVKLEDASSGKEVMTATFKTYAKDQSTIVFEQSFPMTLINNNKTKMSANTLFPGFYRNSTAGDLDCFSYHGVFPSMEATTVKNYKDSHQGGIPLVMYDSNDKSLPMATFSPLNMPKAQHFTTTDDVIGAGVKSTVIVIPEGWVQSFILVAGNGINDGMMAWGDRVLKFTGKPRADMYRDTTHSTIGFWTDNGGFYHYSLGKNVSKNTTYEDVLPKVKAYHDDIGVPFGHWQFDSWFYPKDGKVNAGGGGGAVTNWTAMPSVFPHGMAYIQSKLKVPMVMHNRQWSDKSDYIKNLAFEWYTSKYAIPKDPIAFFKYFFTLQEGWGLAMYEQDWMCTEYDGQEELQNNITMGDLWLLGMATGAASSNRTVQYCMPYAHDIMSASAYPAVTNARATGDYFHGPHQWSVGTTALFYWALGILPFKDGFYSSTNKQVGGQTVGPELNPDREAIMATLSCAMVGPMDGIYLLNKTRVMTTCNGDGLVLKPDRPVTTSDACFTAKNPTCYIYHTYSDVSNVGRVHYLFNSDMTPNPFTPEQVYLNESSAYAVYNWYSGEVMKLSASMTLAPGYEGHVYAVATPIVGGYAFLGETNKYVTAAGKRFSSVKPTSNGFSVTVMGTKNETVTVCAAKMSGDMKPECAMVMFTDAGEKTVTVPPTKESLIL